MKRLYITFAILVFTMLFLLSCSARSGYEKSFPQQNAEAVSQPPSTGPAMLRVLVDLRASDIAIHRTEDIKEFLKEMPGYKESFDIQFEYLPTFDSAPERNTEIDRLRLDLMQDKGPDIIICQNFYMDPQELEWTGLSKTGLKSIFNIPQSAMKQRLFLPLDGYIANAQYMEWDKLLPKVMEAGKDGEGRQVLLPLVYSFRASLFEGESGMDQQAFPMTRGQMLESEDPYIKGIASDGWCVFADALCGLVDYETEELNFTQQELLDLAKRLKTAREQGAIDCPGLVESGIEFGVPYRQIGGKESPDYVLIPSYHQEGGVTAYISAYAAINRSTQHPDQCFAILDWLLSKESQRTAGWNDLGLPVHIDLGLHGESVRGWYLSDWNFAQFVSARDQIDKAVFRGPLYTEMLDLNDKVLRAESDAELEKLVHDSYARMRMILAES